MMNVRIWTIGGLRVSFVSVAATMAILSSDASASMLEAARECLEQLQPHLDSSVTHEPQSFGVRLSNDRTETTCRIAMPVSSSEATALYEITLSTRDLHLISARLRNAGRWVDLPVAARRR